MMPDGAEPCAAYTKLRERMEQIIAVCDDNKDVGNTALALKFVRDVAATALKQ